MPDSTESNSTRHRKIQPFDTTTTMSPSPPSSYSTSAARPPPRYIELRPKGEGVLITFPEGASGQVDSRRKRHALSQKNQRDRLKAALEQMARVLHAGGVGSVFFMGLLSAETRAAGSGMVADGVESTLQVELIETAVEYIQSLEKEVKTLRSSVKEVPRRQEGVACSEQ
ncbi:uncharacterized protein CDV56_102768 [Aspergillus thermomutatus]|uniref:BHLH domain-containing protein n=1 Tax=Aspergillus thermomutatus TaxID=41047 RepID=A0A397GBG7_ASPTH|nr:uncharacterized protein CDV56_102768 [Aspergillus thermomutatus]RHZ47224.1 hypothetical protein CDV56_102768 [Aspergillus thermomutatus]